MGLPQIASSQLLITNISARDLVMTDVAVPISIDDVQSQYGDRHLRTSFE